MLRLYSPPRILIESLVQRVSARDLRRRAFGVRPDLSLFPARGNSAGPMMAAVAAFSRRSNLTEETDASADFLLLEKLGEGSFGKVYRAQQHSIKRHVAIKVVPVAQDTGEVAREIETLKECDSDNIVRCGPHRRPDTFFLGASIVAHPWSSPARRYYGSFQRGPELWIVMEFCEGSSLCDIMEARRLGSPWDPPPHTPSPAPLLCRVLQGSHPARPHCPHAAAAGHPPLLHRGADRRGYGGDAGGPHLPPPAQQDSSRHQGGAAR
jgi:hypothetical protein